MFEKYPVFIVGLPRSGTTLLTRILNSSKEIFVIPETHYFTNYARLFDKYNCQYSLKKYEKICKWYLNIDSFNLKPHYGIEAFGFNKDEKEELLKEVFSMGINFISLFNEILIKYACKKNILRWGEKTPNHFMNVTLIQKYYPTAKFINIIRDPRDVILSLRKVSWEKGNEIQWINNWKKNIELINSINPETVLTIRYEDLLTQTEDIINKICNFIDIKYTEEMMRFFEMEENKNYDAISEPWKKNVENPIVRDNFNKWIIEFTEIEKSAYSRYTMPYLCFFGYKPYEQKSKIMDVSWILLKWICNRVLIFFSKFNSLLFKLKNPQLKSLENN
jgi:Sulfotransferase family